MTHAPVAATPFVAAYDDLTGPLREAVSEAEELIRSAPFVRSEADLLEGYDYLSGRVRMAVQMAFDHDLDRPLLINSTHQFSRQGLDNPDALYWSTYLSPEGEYVVRGRRGTTADLSFQVLGGGYTDAGAPESLAAFDDRELEIADDGSFEWRFGPMPGAKTLIVREVYSDWEAEERGSMWIERVDTLGQPTATRTPERMRQRWEIAGKLLVGSIRTWLEFPKWFTWSEPPNTLTVPRSTPGGLASQFSSLGHYALADDEALVITVPACGDCSYQAVQIGSDWYASTDYETHQTSLTAAQAHVDDGVIRCVVSERDPGLANWLETTGHPTGPMMLRWQRLSRELTAADGPSVEAVPFSSLASRTDLDSQRVSAEQWRERIIARQRGVARRGLS